MFLRIKNKKIIFYYQTYFESQKKIILKNNYQTDSYFLCSTLSTIVE